MSSSSDKPHRELAKGAAIGAVSGSVAATVAVPAVHAVGFTSAGVTGGSFAAGMMSAVGNVSAGSLVASLQSIGAAGIAVPGVAAIVGTGIVIGIGIKAYQQKSKL